MTKKHKIIDGIIKVATKTHPDSEIILYGSQARGDANKESDWDLLILLNQPNLSFEQETKIMDDYYELELAEGIVISPMIYTKNDWNTKYANIPLHSNINREGIKIR
ncbi:MAG: nucleotidyltransferase domain-containing protein [Cyclobacteriaceae bacterium]|nr:nucleotidyltransferase domain-containing protein [Cyclobacteriaceae bacterium]